MRPLLLHFVMTSLMCDLTTNQASLRVSPQRTQFEEEDYVELSCDEGWDVKRNLSGTPFRRPRIRSPCKSWGLWKTPTCTITYLTTLDTGVYWCENSEGQTSSSVYITVTDEPLVQQAPAVAAKTSATAAAQTSSTTAAQSSSTAAQLTAALPARSLGVALVCHLLVLCPYVISTVLMVSLYCQRI